MQSPNRLDTLFATKQRGILSLFATAGFPERHSLVPVTRALQESGVDMIEVGMPFSDPLADGPTIQHSSEVALANGMTLEGVIEEVRQLRREVTIPVLLMGYINPVLQYGVERFCRDAAAAGADGLILPDVPLAEYREWLEPAMRPVGLKSVFLMTQDTAPERIRLLDEAATGFLYAVSTPSITGNTRGFPERAREYLQRVGTMGLKNRVIVGFGIHDRESYLAATEHVSGAIVGSAFIRALGEGQRSGAPVEQTTAEFVKALRGR